MTRNGRVNAGLLGFVFWSAFLLVLEPANVAKASALGHQLTFGREAARITVAALIGAAAMPALLYVLRRYPVSSLRKDAANAGWLVLGLLVLAGLMNLVSCVAAAWVWERNWLPSGSAVSRQLIGNWMLLTFALIGLSAIVRAFRLVSGAAHAALKPEAARSFVGELVIKTGTRSVRVDLKEVDWIEAQGNYVGLHVGDRMHLHRQPLKSFVTDLDAALFVRIHRGAVVALDRVEQIRSEGDGEAMVCLSNGRELRVSKPYRRLVRERWVSRSRICEVVDQNR